MIEGGPRARACGLSPGCSCAHAGKGMKVGKGMRVKTVHISQQTNTDEMRSGATDQTQTE